jgi:uncharacterized protein
MPTPVCRILAAFVALGACAAPRQDTPPDASTAPFRQPLAANCDAPIYAIDRLVCADSDLLALDRAMGERLGQRSPATSPIIEDQGAWFRRRNLCAFQTDALACARLAYRERLAVLDALLEPTTASPLRVRCQSVAGDVRAWMTPERVVLFRPGGAVVGVALRYDEPAPWRPFLTFVADADSLELTRRDGIKWRCRLHPR